jgi:hypothetical protein
MNQPNVQQTQQQDRQQGYPGHFIPYSQSRQYYPLEYTAPYAAPAPLIAPYAAPAPLVAPYAAPYPQYYHQHYHYHY